jgi:hypothetical protein
MVSGRAIVRIDAAPPLPGTEHAARNPKHCSEVEQKGQPLPAQAGAPPAQV